MSEDFDFAEIPGNKVDEPTEAEAALDDWLSENPPGSKGFAENQAEYRRLAQAADAHLDDADDADIGGVEYPEGSPESVLAATDDGKELLREWGDAKNVSDNIAIAKEQAMWIEQNNPGLARWAAEQHEKGTNVMSDPNIIQWLVQQGRERLYGPASAPNAPAQSQTPRHGKPGARRFPRRRMRP